jgi:hypothetical protein
MANAIGQLKAQGSGNLPAQTVPNPNVNSNVSAITLRSGRVSEPALEKKKKQTTPEPEPEHVTEPAVTTDTETEEKKEFMCHQFLFLKGCRKIKRSQLRKIKRFWIHSEK